MQVSRSLALIHINHSIVYLGTGTKLGSSGAGPGTLSSWVEKGVLIHSYVVLQVSIRLDLSHIYPTDLFKAN